jgi:hypothetical protein
MGKSTFLSNGLKDLLEEAIARRRYGISNRFT